MSEEKEDMMHIETENVHITRKEKYDLYEKTADVRACKAFDRPAYGIATPSCRNCDQCVELSMPDPEMAKCKKTKRLVDKTRRFAPSWCEKRKENQCEK